MLQANLEIIAVLKGFVRYVFSNKNILCQFSRTRQDFIRRRKLPFCDLVLLILKLCKKTLSVEIDKFFEEMGTSMNCSVSAFTQQRHKLRASFFYYWNLVLWLSFYHYYAGNVKRWRGLRLIAIDGSTVSLVNNKALSSYFGGQSNQHTSFICGQTFYCYDILNELVLYSTIAPYRVSELKIAWDLIGQLSADVVTIYDRNFCNYKTVALHRWQEQEIKFVIRAKENLCVIKEFIASGKKSSLVGLRPGKKAIDGMRTSGYIITEDQVVNVRLVRVELNTTVEVLMTNLWEEEGYKTSEFKDLYFKRWSIETAIGFQKNVLQMESFSGLTVHAVMQDFYATVFMANLHSLLIKDAQQQLDQCSYRKYPLKVNKNKSYAKLKAQLISIFITRKPLRILKTLQFVFSKDPILVRKGRSFKRKRKNPQNHSKYKTYTNFKPAY